MRVALRQRLAVVDDVQLAAEDRLDALVGGGLVEIDRAGHRAVVGERDCGHLELRGLPRERRDPARPVEDGVLGVDVQVDERRGHGKAIVLPRSDGLVSRGNARSGPSAGDPGLDNRATAPITRACGRCQSHSSSWRR